MQAADGHTTGHWANRQAHARWKHNGALRPAEDKTINVVSLVTEWPDGHIAKATKNEDESFVVIYEQNGQRIGKIGYSPQSQTLLWKFPGITQGYLTPDRLDHYGGFPFSPDLEWGTVQAFAFKHLAAQPRVPQRAGLIERLTNAAMPTLHANEVGCDGLHWLDGTVLRYCCDIHDQCHAILGCSYSSWAFWWYGSWSCNYCNADVVWCFAGGGDPCILNPMFG